MVACWYNTTSNISIEKRNNNYHGILMLCYHFKMHLYRIHIQILFEIELTNYYEIDSNYCKWLKIWDLSHISKCSFSARLFIFLPCINWLVNIIETSFIFKFCSLFAYVYYGKHLFIATLMYITDTLYKLNSTRLRLLRVLSKCVSRRVTIFTFIIWESVILHLSFIKAYKPTR